MEKSSSIIIMSNMCGELQDFRIKDFHFSYNELNVLIT